MTTIFTPFEKRKLTAKNKALLAEWKEIHELCDVRRDISYTIVETNKTELPVKYEITYKVPSFVDLDSNKPVEKDLIEVSEKIEKFLFHPKFSEVHRMLITIPPSFPQVNGKPKGSITTKIWHPNIICHGDDNIVGRVCFNEGNLDASVTIVDRILQVADYLTYKNYLAEDREPYPYDLEVALWIREIAEPLGWVLPEYGINYEKFGIEIKEHEPVKKDAEVQEPVVDDDIVVLDEDEDEEFEFKMDLIENDLDEEKNDKDDVIEI